MRCTGSAAVALLAPKETVMKSRTASVVGLEVICHGAEPLPSVRGFM